MIVKLGPPIYGEDRLYSYIVVASSPNQKPWFVFVRNIDEFQEQYEIEMKQWLKNNSFSDPFTINQPRECVYAEVTEGTS